MLPTTAAPAVLHKTTHAPPLGTIGSRAPSATSPLRHDEPPDFFDTLDEPVMHTVMRELRAIAAKLRLVCFPPLRMLLSTKGSASASSSSAAAATAGSASSDAASNCGEGSRRTLLHDWDLWGPLLLCLALSLTMSFGSSADSGMSVFTAFFALFWFGAAVVSVNAKLLGSTMSFFQSVCVLGYSMFPILAAALINSAVKNAVVKYIVAMAGCAWSSLVSAGFLRGANVENKLLLVLYPIFLLYFAVSWMVFVLKAI